MSLWFWINANVYDCLIFEKKRIVKSFSKLPRYDMILFCPCAFAGIKDLRCWRSYLFLTKNKKVVIVDNREYWSTFYRKIYVNYLPIRFFTLYNQLFDTVQRLRLITPVLLITNNVDSFFKGTAWVIFSSCIKIYNIFPFISIDVVSNDSINDYTLSISAPTHVDELIREIARSKILRYIWSSYFKYGLELILAMILELYKVIFKSVYSKKIKLYLDELIIISQISLPRQ